MVVGDAVKQGIINNETLGYFMVRTHAFLTGAGIKPHHLRFRQHLPTEMAHYACDCWDAEIFSSYGWLECVGIADRACFDLNAHAQATKTDLSYKEMLDKPIEREVVAVTKAAGIAVMKAFKKDGKMVKEWIEALPQDELMRLESALASAGQDEVEIDGRKFVLKADVLKFEKKKEKQTVNTFTPGVVEPSFGIDRIFACMLEHAYYARPKDESSDDKQTRGVLALAPNMAPYKCVILPLDQRIARHEKYHEIMGDFRSQLSALGFSYTVDESGVAIGRRYSRNDELGIPFAVTVDFDSLEDFTVTLRERDAMQQIRLPCKDVADLLRDLCLGEVDWAATYKKYSK